MSKDETSSADGGLAQRDAEAEGSPAGGTARGPASSSGSAPPSAATPPRRSVWHTVLDRAILRRRARRKRRRRIRLAILVALISLLVGGYLFMTSNRQVERLVVDYLEDMFQGQVHIKTASFSFLGGLRIEGITITLDDPSRPVFQAESLRLAHDPLALLVGRLKVSELVAIRPQIHLERQDGRWNFERMFPETVTPTAVGQRPSIYVENGTLSVRQLEGGRVTYEHRLTVSGVIQPDASREGLFTFFAGEVGSGGVRGSISRGEVDLTSRRVSFEGQAVNVKLSKEVAETLPPEAQALWDRFTPSGQVSLRVSFVGRPLASNDMGFRLEVNLDNVSLAYQREGRTFHLRNLTGRCVIGPKRLEVQQVHGVLTTALPAGPTGAAEPGEEVSLPISMTGDVTGIDDGTFVPSFRVKIDDLDLARLAPLAGELWRGGANFYRNFQPSGRVDVSLDISRELPPESPLRLSGTIQLRDGRVVNRWFPYPAENVSGLITLAPHQLSIAQLEGRHGSSQMTVSGRVDDPDGPAEVVDLTIECRGVALDESLRQAVAQGFPEQLALYDSLHPEGQVDVRVHVTEDLGRRERLDAVADITLRDTKVVYDAFPYAVEGGVGSLRMTGRRVDVDVRGRHGPAEVGIRGDIQWAAGDPSSRAAIRLNVTGRGVPLDEDLAAALPAEQRATYNEYHLSGSANMAFDITCDETTQWKVAHRGDIEFKNVGLVFEAFPYPIEGIEGRLELAPGVFLVKDLRGANAEASLSASGNVARRGDRYEVDLTIRGRHVLLDRDLRGAIAMVAPELWSNLTADGRVNVVCRLSQGPEPGSRLAAAVTLDAEDVSVAYKHFPYPLRHCRGRMIYEGGRVIIENLENTEGTTRIRANATVDLGSGRAFRSRLALRAVGVEIDDTLLAALPATFGEPLKALGVHGRVSVHLDDLTYDVDEDGRVTSSWRGSAVLDNAALDLGGVPLDRVVAYAKLDGRFEGDRLALRGAVDMPQGRIDGKDIARLRAELHKEADSPRVAVTRLEADLYGGRLELDSEGVVILGQPARYELAVNIRDVDFQRFLREGMDLESSVEGGRMSGQFALWGSGTEADRVHARVDLQVREGKLYALPAVIQVLNTLRLGASAKSFEEADVTMFLRHGSYIFENLELRGQGLKVHGTGRIDPEGKLDLLLATGSAAGGGLLPALRELAEGVRRELVLVAVTGTTRRPVIEQRNFNTITAPLKELLRLIDESRTLREQQEQRRAAHREKP
jgi:hypothetical protein